MALIGISGSILKETASPFSGYNRSYVNEDYVNAVLKAGGTPVIIPVSDNVDAIREIVDKVDALILSGGHDVTPQLYGENPLRKIGEIFPKRDAFDFMLVEAAKKRNLPILGICRGFQILNVYHGGSLYQDLDYMNNDQLIAHSQVSGPRIKTHGIKLDEKSRFFEMIKSSQIDVNSFHHQTIKTIGDDLRAVAYADDGVIEAFENTQYPWMFGVQFHPEMLHMDDEALQNIFNELVRAVKEP